jgi:hypothetical protein
MKRPATISATGKIRASHTGHGFPARAANSGTVTKAFTTAQT